MIIFIFFAVAALVVALEIITLKNGNRRIKIEYSADLSLVEPGEVITLKYSVMNTGRLPLLFLGLSILLDGGIQLCEDEDWIVFRSWKIKNNK